MDRFVLVGGVLSVHQEMKIFPDRRKSVARFSGVLLLTGVLLGIESRADEPWHYTIGQSRANQQANFCLEKQTAFELARIFERRGPRAGYAALEQTSTCAIKVASFTPQKIITQVTIETGTGGHYTVTFVQVLMSDGAVQYLVTTRGVHESN